MKVQRASEQIIVEEVAQRLADLTARVTELTRRLELSEVLRGNGNGRRDQETNATVSDADDSPASIELITENSFSIVRPWESGNSPAPTGGKCRFRVSDPSGIQRDVTVEISSGMVAQVSRRTRGRIGSSSSFWICCAERRLANFIDENNRLPDGDHMFVEDLDPEAALLAIRWGKSG